MQGSGNEPRQSSFRAQNILSGRRGILQSRVCIAVLLRDGQTMKPAKRKEK